MLSLADLGRVRGMHLATLRDTCVVVRAAAGASEDGYNAHPDWDNPRLTTVACRFDNGTSSTYGRTEVAGANRTVVQAAARFWIAPDADVTEADRIRYAGQDLDIAGVNPPSTYGALKAVMIAEAG